MAIILGLDVSTSCTGVCVVDSTVEPDDRGSHILLLEQIEFGAVKTPSVNVPACNTLWEKADRVDHAIKIIEMQIGLSLHKVPGFDRVVLEEPLMGFRPGMSSAQTISQLMRFNGVVSYIARNRTGCEPEYIGSAHARKLCGIKLQHTAAGGPQKLQVFKHMVDHDLKHVMWPLKKSGKIVDWATDVCDAYVIARAATLSGPVQVQSKKSRKKVQ